MANKSYQVIKENEFIHIGSHHLNQFCKYCKNKIFSYNDNIVLFRTFITLLDFDNNVLLLKCGNCKKINNFNFEIVFENNRYIIKIKE